MKGEIDLTGAKIVSKSVAESNGEKYAFAIASSLGDEALVATNDDADRQEWIRQINNVIQGKTQEDVRREDEAKAAQQREEAERLHREAEIRRLEAEAEAERQRIAEEKRRAEAAEAERIRLLPKKFGLKLNARGLPKMDMTSHTDAFAVVFLEDASGQTVTLGHTHVMDDTENPTWDDEILVTYIPDTTQKVTVKVYDCEGSAALTNLAAHTFIGEANLVLARLVSVAGRPVEENILNEHNMFHKNRGKVHVTATLLQPPPPNEITLTLSARGLPKMDVTSHTDAFAALFLGGRLLGHTHVVNDTENPTWSDKILVEYSPSEEQKITVKVFDKEGSEPLTDFAAHTFVGEAHVLLSQLVEGQPAEIELMNEQNMFHTHRGQVCIRGVFSSQLW